MEKLASVIKKKARKKHRINAELQTGDAASVVRSSAFRRLGGAQEKTPHKCGTTNRDVWGY